MSTFNRGEWSEMYAILCMLLYPNLSLCDENLKEITNKLYTLERIQLEHPNSMDGIIEYCLDNQSNVEIFGDGELKDIIDQFELSDFRFRMLEAIRNAPADDGAFEIRGIDDLLIRLNRGEKIKSNSFRKEDLNALIHDNKLGRESWLKYSIKSSLGSPATLLNASKSTNFLYSISGVDDSIIDEVNGIQTHNKLIDRMNLLLQSGGQIEFERVCDPVFQYNLQMIDSQMPEYLAIALLNSYITDIKDLKELFLSSIPFYDDNFALRKLGDLLEGISFGFFPSIQWNGRNQVNGGLVIVRRDGNVVILDLNYFRDEVKTYLINETKLESPSSTRYEMLHLFKSPDDEKIYFTLNLQIRYKR